MIRKIRELLCEITESKPPLLIDPSTSEIRKLMYHDNSVTTNQFGNTQREEFIRFILDSDFYYVADGRYWTHDQMLEKLKKKRTDFDFVTGWISDNGKLSIFKYAFFKDYLNIKDKPIIYFSEDESTEILANTKFFQAVKPLIKSVEWIV